MELKEMIRSWNNSADLNEFLKSLKSDELSKEDIEEFKSFLFRSYGTSFNSDSIVEKIIPLAS